MNNNTIDPFSDIKELAHAESIWNVAPVIDEPEITLVRWQIVKLKQGTAHFVGYNSRGREGRVSNTIVDFDPNTRRGRTKSGRVYQLFGSAGYDADAEWVLDKWLDLQGLTRDAILEYDTLGD